MGDSGSCACTKCHVLCVILQGNEHSEVGLFSKKN